MTNVHIAANERFLRTGNNPVLTVMSAGHALHVYVNGKLVGNAYGSLENPKLTFNNQVKLRAGVNKIALLSVVVGLAAIECWDIFETWNEGVLGPVNLKDLTQGTRDLTWQRWSYKNGMKGENMGLDTISGSSSVEWARGSLIAQRQSLAWYKTTFNAPTGNDPLAYEHNGEMRNVDQWSKHRRHWPANKATRRYSQCNYAGTFTETKCLSNCGQTSQRWYHFPRSWMKPSGNLLVVFEEWGRKSCRDSVGQEGNVVSNQVCAVFSLCKFPCFSVI